MSNIKEDVSYQLQVPRYDYSIRRVPTILLIVTYVVQPSIKSGGLALKHKRMPISIDRVYGQTLHHQTHVYHMIHHHRQL